MFTDVECRDDIGSLLKSCAAGLVIAGNNMRWQRKRVAKHWLPFSYHSKGRESDSYSLRRLRTFAATPAKPVPSRIIVAGSGTAEGEGAAFTPTNRLSKIPTLGALTVTPGGRLNTGPFVGNINVEKKSATAPPFCFAWS